MEDTIVAPITPSGHSGIGVIRFSGPKAPDLIEGLTGKSINEFKGRRATLADLFDPTDNVYIDTAVVTYFPGPGSYTGEDVVEVSVHGNPVLVQAVCQCAISLGARMADPGEFTRRAFLNGRIDLSQAEAVSEMISAGTLLAAKAAGRRLSGELSGLIAEIRSNLLESLIHLEAAVDFPEEELEIISEGEIGKVLSTAIEASEKLLASYRAGRILAEGIRIVIAGRPNVGKSSLLNRLLGEERAIVSSEPGTTRDFISEPLSVMGIPVKVIDTAGIRVYADDAIEVEGARRSMKAIEDADLVLMVIDGSQAVSGEDEACKEIVIPREHIVVINKEDLGLVADLDALVGGEGFRGRAVISAKTGSGIEGLKKLVYGTVSGGSTDLQREIMIGNIRQKQMLERALKGLVAAARGIEGGLSPELISFEVREASSFLGEFMGEITTEEVLESIFSNFCIGK